jgi:hypothetical protein
MFQPALTLIDIEDKQHDPHRRQLQYDAPAHEQIAIFAIELAAPAHAVDTHEQNPHNGEHGDSQSDIQ